ncbi:hypothetical protein KIPB_011339, partial [Kipferlia bialata]
PSPDVPLSVAGSLSDGRVGFLSAHTPLLIATGTPSVVHKEECSVLRVPVIPCSEDVDATRFTVSALASRFIQSTAGNPTPYPDTLSLPTAGGLYNQTRPYEVSRTASLVAPPRTVGEEEEYALQRHRREAENPEAKAGVSMQRPGLALVPHCEGMEIL